MLAKLGHPSESRPIPLGYCNRRSQPLAAALCALTLLLLGFLAPVSADILPPEKYTQPMPQDSVKTSPGSIDPAPRETDAGRWSLPLQEVLQRTYDISGQKSEWILGTSLLGNPELEASAMGIGSISRRYPSKLAGLYTTRLGFDGSALGLNGENGILFEEPKGIATDTPIVDLNWERPAFSGNALRLDFRRLVTDSVTLDFGLASHSDVDSKEYSYTNVTHSPYFALGRDSTQIPFGGRNIAMNSMHIQPMLTWRFGLGKAFVKMNYFSLENADNTNHKVLLDTLDKSIRTFQTPPYTIDISTVTYGAGIELYPIKNLVISASATYGDHEIEEDSLARIYMKSEDYIDTAGVQQSDTTFYDTVSSTTYQTVLGSFGIGYHSILNPTIKLDYEFLNAENPGTEQKNFEQDREIGYLQLSDTLGFVSFRTQVGLQRNSSVRNKIDKVPAYSVDVTGLLPFYFRLNGSFRHDSKFPDVSQLKFVETGRLAFPNKHLKYEERERSTLNLSWMHRRLFAGAGLRYEEVDNLIKPKWVKWGAADSTRSIDEAFKWTNLSEVSTLDWMLQLGLRLGNWKFYLERGEVLDRSRRIIDSPELYYKGSIHWQNRFVFDRLGVSIRVDWQWFGDRYDCTINENGNLELEYMKHYLALDFEARMQILQFELYSRIENFNHSIYMPESGYTPEGIRFAYGIVWTFGN